jgi:hypothetical protein
MEIVFRRWAKEEEALAKKSTDNNKAGSFSTVSAHP